MVRKKRISEKFVLIFWPESSEVSVVPFSDVSQAVRPENIKMNWRGDLPWLEAGSIELFEALILRISSNKKYLEWLPVSNTGRVLPRKILFSEDLQSEMRMASNRKKQQKALREKGRQYLDTLVPSAHTATTSSGIAQQHRSATSSGSTPSGSTPSGSTPSSSQKGDGSSPAEEIEGSDEDDEIEPVQDSNQKCEACELCICKQWRDIISPEVMAVMQQMVASIMKAKKTNGVLPAVDTMITLHPKFPNFRLSESSIMDAYKESNKKKKPMIRRILHLLHSEDVILNSTASTLPTGTKEAITNLLHKKFGSLVGDEEYKKVINSRIIYLKSKKEDLLSAEKKALLKAKKDESKKSHQRRKAEGLPKVTRRKPMQTTDDSVPTNKKAKKSAPASSEPLSPAMDCIDATPASEVSHSGDVSEASSAPEKVGAEMAPHLNNPLSRMQHQPVAESHQHHHTTN